MATLTQADYEALVNGTFLKPHWWNESIVDYSRMLSLSMGDMRYPHSPTGCDVCRQAYRDRMVYYNPVLKYQVI